ncbi:hypothetical protein CMV_003573 [Castanea mollissima]|uniref:Uncharacterized protein n=1 Tax=Castanea mollissima TaxID=60419 RepID=A0A8J4VV18_9ROSI|nr:hypothetical protein CMV_003573 [Castanea mollissima]
MGRFERERDRVTGAEVGAASSLASKDRSAVKLTVQNRQAKVSVVSSAAAAAAALVIKELKNISARSSLWKSPSGLSERDRRI